VVNNLLSNALKYSKKGSRIDVTCTAANDQVRVEVKDEGIGIKPQDQQKLFERFYRVADEKMKSVSGFGIGLYLASEIVKYHHGTIGLESVEGEGSTFWFTIPLKQPLAN